MTLFIVATPIGTLGDMTFRAVETLKSVDLVAAEDTRTAKKLFAKFDVHTQLLAFHAHSSLKTAENIIKQIKNGKSVALISEAGTPGISDPGYVLVHTAVEAGVKVVPIPGASAVITALSASGLPTDKFVYLGFLPTKKGRKTIMESLREEKRTVVFYESPHRVQKTISQLVEILGDERKIVIARELTKIYEEFFRGTLIEALDFIQAKKPRGEFTVILAGTR